MKCQGKTTLRRRVANILLGNEGTSLVLVTIIAILIVTGVVVLRMTTSTLWASADKQYNQDRAYEMATSMGATVDALIADGVVKLDDYQGANRKVIIEDSAGDGTVVVYVTQSGLHYLIEVQSEVAGATYLYSAYYVKTSNTGPYTRQLV